MNKKINLLFFILIFFCFSSKATVVYVDSAHVGGVQNGTSWATAFSNLQAAIEAATLGDSVWVAKGTYKPSVWGVSFSMRQEVHMFGGFENTSTTFASRNWRINTTKLIGSGSFKTMVNVMAITPQNSTILDGFVFANNERGAIYTEYWNGVIRNCKFISNKVQGTNSDYDGGALLSVNSRMNINNCLFSNNKAFRGGGAIAIDRTSMTLFNCVFYQNEANEYGLDIAIFNGNSSATLINNTFYKSKGIGDGVIYSFGLSLKLFNSIIWGNTGGVSFSINAPVIANCLIQGRAEEPSMNNLAGTIDPMLVDDINSYFTLQNNSPCIDKGKDSFYNDYAGDLLTSKGIDGTPRLTRNFIDMGASENQPNTGINDINSSGNSLIIFPNPSKETIHISFTNEKLLHTKAILTDIYGRTVREVMLNSKSQQFSLAGLSSGIYILKSITGNSVKIIKE